MWALVTVTPEEIKIKEFNKGTWKGFKGSIPKGGQKLPTSIAGFKVKWKKAQKKEKKNIISEIINKTIPNLIIFWTFMVWHPCPVLSRTTSRNHKFITKRKLKKAKNRFKFIIDFCIL